MANSFIKRLYGETAEPHVEQAKAFYDNLLNAKSRKSEAVPEFLKDDFAALETIGGEVIDTGKSLLERYLQTPGPNPWVKVGKAFSVNPALEAGGRIKEDLRKKDIPGAAGGALGAGIMLLRGGKSKGIRPTGVEALLHDVINERGVRASKLLPNSPNPVITDRVAAAATKPVKPSSAGMKDGYKYQIRPGKNNSVVITAHDTKNLRTPASEDNLVGIAQLEKRGAGLYPKWVNVADEHQRKGIASTMYDLSKKQTRIQQILNGAQTPEGEAFRTKYDKRQSRKDSPFEEMSPEARRALGLR